VVDLTRQGPVFILAMRSGENRFNRPFLDALVNALDEIEGSGGPTALVTVGEDKFYSNGLDLNWLMGEGAAEGPTFVGHFLAFLGRFLGLSIPTVAAMNGHAFAGGGMFALAHDFRVMRADRGFFCLPEIDINLPFAPGMRMLIQAKLDPSVSRDLMLTGRRVGGADAATLRIVDETATGDDVLTRAIERAAALATKDRGTFSTIKRSMYAPIIRALEDGTLA